MKNSTLWITIVVIIVLIIIGVMAMGAKNDEVLTPVLDTVPTTTVDNSLTGTTTTTNSTDAVAPKTVTVEYKDTGFTPSTVTINAGDTVKFVNNASSQMWVASSPHPQHTDYPEFEQGTAVGNGGTYSFTFTKVGSWKYHNHVVAGKFGTVIVK